MLTKCLNCGFLVQHDDDYCLNCGIDKPTEDTHVPSFVRIILIASKMVSFKVLLGLLLSLLILFLIADSDLANVFYLRDGIIIFGLVIGFSLSFTIVPLIRRLIKNNLLQDRNKTSDNLTLIKRTIDSRISDLSKRRSQIDVVLNRIQFDDGERLQETRTKLLAARKLVNGQHARYDVQAKKIEMVRLQNSVLPYLENHDGLNEFEVETGLFVIESAKREIWQTREKLSTEYASELPKSAQSEMDSFVRQLNETEESCLKIRETLLSNQARRALEGISTDNEIASVSGANEIARAFETFNIQSTITDFSESFEELEREYMRLRAEKEIS